MYGARALACTAFGECAKAERLAERTGALDRAETLAGVAALLAGLPDDVTFIQLELLSPADPHLLRLCAAVPDPGREPARSASRARRLVADVLGTDGWHYAPPVLAEPDPDAVRRVRDVVFAQLELEGDAHAAPPPPPAPA